MTQVVEWYAAQRYQVCPRARKYEFIDNVERREMAPNQAAARYIRRGIHMLAAGGDYATVPDQMMSEFMEEVRVRGLDAPRPYETAKRLAGAIHGVLYSGPFEWAKTHEVHAPDQVQFELTSEIDFRVRRPIFLRNHSGGWYLLYPKVTGDWRGDYTSRVWREFQLLSELAALRRFSQGGHIAGTLVLPISLNRASVGETFVAAYDDQAVVDWLQQVEAQEQRIFDNQILATVYADAAESNVVRYANNQFFPQHRMSCDRPYPCEFAELCWGDLSTGADPLADPRYRLRVGQ